MGSLSRKIQKNAENFTLNEYYKNMTPEMYKEGLDRAIKMTEQKCIKEYNTQLIRMSEQYNESIRNSTFIAMDTLATEYMN